MKTNFAILMGLALLANAGLARAQEPGETTGQAAVKVAVGTCAICHGPEGNSIMPKFPKLAGQRENYLVAQLKAFRSQARGDADALGYMWGMAAPLDDDMINELARYYASRKSTPGKASEGAALARGGEIYQRGVASEGIPACASCHGANAEGQGDYPRLAGQHAEYSIKQLYSFRNQMRNVAIMHGIAREMKIGEMEAIAEYLQSK